MYKLLFLVLALTAVSCHKIHIDQCGEGGEELDYADVTPCDKDPCDFVPGNTYRLKGGFKSGLDAERPYLRVQVKALGLWLDYPIDTNPCTKFMKCPVQKGQDVELNLDVQAIGLVHNIDTEVKFSLFTDDSKTTVLTCGIAKVHAV